MAKQTPEKCKRCAPLTPADARAKHPSCWDDKLCTARRFYINNRDRINQKRSRKRIETNHQVSTPDVKYGILHVWRENREDSPIHAKLARRLGGRGRDLGAEYEDCNGGSRSLCGLASLSSL
jgi:hypothetical protein